MESNLSPQLSRSTTINHLPDELFNSIFSLLNISSLKNCCLVCKKWLQLINCDFKIMRKLESKFTQDTLPAALNNSTLLRQHTNIALYHITFSMALVTTITESSDLFKNAEQIDFHSCEFVSEDMFHTLLMDCHCLKHLIIRNPKIIESMGNDAKEQFAIDLKTLSLEITYCWEYTTDWIRIFKLIPSKYSSLNIMICGHEWQKQELFFEYIHNQPHIQKALKHLALHYSCDSGETNGVFKYVANMQEMRLETFERHASIYLDPSLADRFIAMQTSLTKLTLQHSEPKGLFETITKCLQKLQSFSFRLKCECLPNICKCFTEIGLKKLKQLEYLCIGCVWAIDKDGVELDCFADLNFLKEFTFSGRYARYVNLIIEERNTFVSLRSFKTFDMRVPSDPTWRTICRNMPNLTHLSINDENNLNDFSFVDHNFRQLANLRNIEVIKLDGMLDKENLFQLAKQLSNLKCLIFDKFLGIISIIFNSLCFKDLKLCRHVSKTWFDIINNDIKLMRRFNLELHLSNITEIISMPPLFGNYRRISIFDVNYSVSLHDSLKQSNNCNIFQNVEELKLWQTIFNNENVFHDLLFSCENLKFLHIIEILMKFSRSDRTYDQRELRLKQLFLQFGYGCQLDWSEIFELIPMQVATLKLNMSRGETHEQQKFMEYVLANPFIQQALKHLELGYLCDEKVSNGIFGIISKMDHLKLEAFTRYRNIFSDINIANSFLNKQTSLMSLRLDAEQEKVAFDTIASRLVNLRNLSFCLKCECNQTTCKCFAKISELKRLETAFLRLSSCKEPTKVVELQLADLRYLHDFSICGMVNLSLVLVDQNKFDCLKTMVVYDMLVPNQTWEFISRKIPNLQQLRIEYKENIDKFNFNYDGLTGLKNLECLTLDGPMHLNDVQKATSQTPKLKWLVFKEFYGGQIEELHTLFQLVFQFCPFLGSIDIGAKAYDRNELTKGFSITQRYSDDRFTDLVGIMSQNLAAIDWDDY